MCTLYTVFNQSAGYQMTKVADIETRDGWLFHNAVDTARQHHSLHCISRTVTRQCLTLVIMTTSFCSCMQIMTCYPTCEGGRLLYFVAFE